MTNFKHFLIIPLISFYAQSETETRNVSNSLTNVKSNSLFTAKNGSPYPPPEWVSKKDQTSSKLVDENSVDIVSFLTGIDDARLINVEGHSEDDSLLRRNVPLIRDKKQLEIEIPKDFTQESSKNQEGVTADTQLNTLCSKNFSSTEFYLQFPDQFSLDSTSLMTCKYTIAKSKDNICGILFTIISFNLDAESITSESNSTKCSGNSFSLNNQEFCGPIKPNSKGLIAFKNSTSLTVQLNIRNPKGLMDFLMKGTQVEDCTEEKSFSDMIINKPSECVRLISSSIFNISSPFYPLRYLPNLSCQYRVMKSSDDICGIVLTSIYFELESSLSCLLDYVKIGGKKFCGIQPLKNDVYVKFTEPEIEIEFRSDGSVGKRGFHFEGKQLTCEEFSIRDDDIIVPLIANTANELLEDESEAQIMRVTNENLFHTVNPTPTTTYRSTKISSTNHTMDSRGDISHMNSYDRLNVNYHSLANTPYDYVISNINDGIPSEYFSRQLGIDATTEMGIEDFGLTTKTNFNLANNGSYLDQQDKETPPEINESACNQVLSTKYFTILSENYPNDYNNESKCTYKINKYTANVCQLKLILEDVNIEKPINDTENCPYDFIEIAGVKFCGTINNKIVNIEFFDDPFIIRFQTNSHITDSGFTIKGEQLTEGCKNLNSISPLSCNSTVSYQNFTLFSPGYPKYYPSNLMCFVNVQKHNNTIKSLVVLFKEFDLEPSASCSKDFLQIDDRKFCGHRNQNSYLIPFNGHSLPIRFSTDDSETGKGFKLIISQISQTPDDWNNTPQCGGVYYSPFITLTSPNYPSFYLPGVMCNYNITRNSPDVCQLTIKVQDLDIPESVSCNTDYLQIGEKKLCGNEAHMENYHYHFKHNNFGITFKSTSRHPGRGFRIEIKQVICSNPTEMKPWQGLTSDSTMNTGTGIPYVTTPANTNPCGHFISYPTMVSHFTTPKPYYTTKRPYTFRPLRPGYSTLNPYSSTFNYPTAVWINCTLHTFRPYPVTSKPNLEYIPNYSSLRPKNCKICNFIQRKNRNFLRYILPLMTKHSISNRPHNQNYQYGYYGHQMQSSTKRPAIIQTQRPQDQGYHSYVKVNPLSILKLKFPLLSSHRGQKIEHNSNANSMYTHRPCPSKFQSSTHNRPFMTTNRPFSQHSFTKMPQATKSMYKFKPIKNPLYNKSQISFTYEPDSTQHGTSSIHQNLSHVYYNPKFNTSFTINGEINTLKPVIISSYFNLHDTPINYNSSAHSLGYSSFSPLPIGEPLRAPIFPPTLLNKNLPKAINSNLPYLGPSNISQNFIRTLDEEQLRAGRILRYFEPSRSLIRGDRFTENNRYCGQNISDPRFQITRPKYISVPRNIRFMRCIYDVYKSEDSNCGLFVNIKNLHFPPSSHCMTTYINIAGRRICGKELRRRQLMVPFLPGNPIRIEFHSRLSDLRAGVGFSMIFQQIKCNESTSKRENTTSDFGQNSEQFSRFEALASVRDISDNIYGKGQVIKSKKILVKNNRNNKTPSDSLEIHYTQWKPIK